LEDIISLLTWKWRRSWRRSYSIRRKRRKDSHIGLRVRCPILGLLDSFGQCSELVAALGLT